MVALARAGPAGQRVLFFSVPPPTRAGQVLLRFALRLGLVARPAVIEQNIGQAYDPAGGNVYGSTIRQAREISTRIRREWILPAPITAALEPQWPREKVAYHLDREMEADVRRECLRVQLAASILGDQLPHGRLLLADRPWANYLDVYARSVGLHVRWYPRPWTRSLTRDIQRIAALGRRALPDRRASSKSVPVTAPLGPSPQASGLVVALRYAHRSLDTERTKRSEFFWIDETAVVASALLYDFTSPVAIEPRIAADLSARQISIVGRAPGVDQWRAGRVTTLVALRSLARLVRAAIGFALRRRSLSGWMLRKVAGMCLEHAYWHEFFAANRVAVNVATWPETSVAQVLALDALGGITVAYQHTASHLIAPSAYVSAGETVQFVFSEEFASLIREADTPCERIIPTGFIYDRAVQQIRSLNAGKDLRSRVRAKGTEFVLCFFDENSADRWDIAASNEEATADYAFLLNWLVEDPLISLIVKVKKASNLRARVSAIAGLLDQAEASGRCVVLRSESSLFGSIYPAEAALAADLCIGKLEGATAAMEARIAGTRTVLIGAPHLLDHPLQEWLGADVVFPNWLSARRAVDEFRLRSDARLALGDWSRGMHRLDPFLDGRAAQAMDLYIASFIRARTAGRSRSEALTHADEMIAIVKRGVSSVAPAADSN